MTTPYDNSNIIVRVHALNKHDELPYGTGFIFKFDEDRGISYVLTCAHVVNDIKKSGSQKFSVVAFKPDNSSDKRVIMDATLLAQGHDLAILKAQGLIRLSTLNINKTVNEGDQVSIIVWNYDDEINEFSQEVLHGTIGDRRKSQIDELVLSKGWEIKDIKGGFKDKGFLDGNSGSPVLKGDIKAQNIIGVVRVKRGTNKGFAISAEHVIEMIINHIEETTYHESTAEKTRPYEIKEKFGFECPYNPCPLTPKYYAMVEDEIFICHAPEDIHYANRIAKCLEEVAGIVTTSQSRDWLDKLNTANSSVIVLSEAFKRALSINGNQISAQYNEMKRKIMELQEFWPIFLKIEELDRAESFKSFPFVDASRITTDINTCHVMQLLCECIWKHRTWLPFGNRKPELRLVLRTLIQNDSCAIILTNENRTSGLGSTMLLWHLGITYLPKRLSPTPIIIPLSFKQVRRDAKDVIHWIEYAAGLLSVSFDLKEYPEALRKFRDETQHWDLWEGDESIFLDQPVDSFGLAPSSIDEEELNEVGLDAELPDIRRHLENLTEAFVRDLKNNLNNYSSIDLVPQIIFLVDGPSDPWEDRWIDGSFREWLEMMMIRLETHPKVFFIVAGTYPFLDNESELYGKIPEIILQGFEESEAFQVRQVLLKSCGLHNRSDSKKASLWHKRWFLDQIGAYLIGQNPRYYVGRIRAEILDRKNLKDRAKALHNQMKEFCRIYEK